MPNNGFVAGFGEFANTPDGIHLQEASAKQRAARAQNQKAARMLHPQHRKSTVATLGGSVSGGATSRFPGPAHGLSDSEESDSDNVVSVRAHTRRRAVPKAKKPAKAKPRTEVSIEQLAENASLLEQMLASDTSEVEQAEITALQAVHKEANTLRELERLQMAYAQAVEANRESAARLEAAKTKLEETTAKTMSAQEILRRHQLAEKRRLLTQAYEAQQEAQRKAQQEQEALFLKQMAELDGEE